MLGKLIKNEFKSNLHTIGMIYLVALASVAVMATSYIFKITWISAVATIVLMLAGVAAVIVTFFCVISEFKKSLFSNQGYLSFTLPVTSGQLLAAKTIVAFCWMLLSYVVALGIFVGVYLYASAMVGDDVKMAIDLMFSIFADLPSKTVIIEVIVMVCLYIFLLMIVLIAELYFAITISNTRVLQKLGGFAAFAAFFVIFIFVTVVSTVLTNVVPFTVVVSSTGIYWSTMASMTNGTIGISFGLAGVIFNAIAAVTLFIGTSALMNSKVNIK